MYRGRGTGSFDVVSASGSPTGTISGLDAETGVAAGIDGLYICYL
jgi:hypothetical protein